MIALALLTSRRYDPNRGGGMEDSAVRRKIIISMDYAELRRGVAGALRAARRMDKRRSRVGPLGLRTRDLVEEGRRR